MAFYLTDEQLEELYPEMNASELRYMKEAISVFTNLFFDCIQKNIGHNQEGED